eukprot:GHVS01041290.1.p1 GENE.GHVS01041290.1~~GHVS01041290.1.p1  ORF type:complete len:1150 (-),score=264.74 GHVS01041290.1:262-3711(-)
MAAEQQQHYERVCQALDATTAGDEALRKQAEEFLQSMSDSASLACVLIDILKHPQLVTSTRTAASVLLKNEIRKSWEKADKQQGYREEDKHKIRSTLYPLLRDLTKMEQPIPIRRQVLECIRLVLFHDFPLKWPDLLPSICADLTQRSDKHGLLAALQTLRKVAAKYETKMTDERGHLDEIIQKAFPLLLDTSAALAQEGMGNSEAMMMLKLICKTYWSCTQLCLSKCGLVYTTLDLWMELMNHIISANVPKELIVGDINDLPQFKLKKWALNIVHRFFARYVGSAPVVSKSSESRLFADKYLKTWAPRHLMSCLDVLKSQQAGECVNSGRVVNLLLQYLMQSVEVGSLYTKFIKPNLDFLLLQVCLPLFCFNVEDEEKWTSDPVEFIRMQTDCTVSYSDPREAAVEFVRWLGRYRGKDCIEKIGVFADNMLSDPNSSNATKSGALLMLGSVANRLTSRKRRVYVEGFLQTKVLPLFCAPVRELRVRSVWVYGHYLDHLNRVGWREPAGLVAAFKQMFELCGDVELPVRVEAGVQIKGFFSINQPQLQEVIKESLGQLMERLFALMHDIDHENLVATVADLVKEYEDQVTPYSRQLMTLLCGALLRMMAKEEVSQDEEMTQLSTLQTIKAVLASASETPHVYDELFPPLIPVLHLLLQPENVEFVDDACDILSFLSFYSSPATLRSLWRFVQYLHLSVCGVVNGLQPPPPQLLLQQQQQQQQQQETLLLVYREGWAPDMMQQMVTPIWNLLTRDGRVTSGAAGVVKMIQCEASVEIVLVVESGSTKLFEVMTNCASGGRPHVNLIVEMAHKAISAEIEPQRGVELLCGLFESYSCTTLLDAVYTEVLDLMLDLLSKRSPSFSPTSNASTAPSVGVVANRTCGVRTRRQSAELLQRQQQQIGQQNDDGDELWEDEEEEESLDRVCELWCVRLVSAVILYNADKFVSWSKCEQLFKYWLSKASAVKSFPERKVYLLALTSLLNLISSSSSTSSVATLLKDCFSQAVAAALSQAEGMMELRRKQQLTGGEGRGGEDIDEESDDEDSEQELEDVQDAQQDERTRLLFEKLQKDNDDDDSDGSDASFEEDDDSDMRLVSLEDMDEVAALSAVFATMADPVKLEVVKCIGAEKLDLLSHLKPPSASSATSSSSCQ